MSIYRERKFDSFISNWHSIKHGHTNSFLVIDIDETHKLHIKITKMLHTHTHTHTHIYIYICVCVCVCESVREEDT